MARIFLSYSHLDAESASLVQRLLEELGHAVWRDAQGVRGGMQWQAAISREISDSDGFVILLTKHSVHSREVQREVVLAYSRQVRMVPVALGAPALPHELAYALAGVHVIEGDIQPGSLKSLLAAALSDIARDTKDSPLQSSQEAAKAEAIRPAADAERLDMPRETWARAPSRRVVVTTLSASAIGVAALFAYRSQVPRKPRVNVGDEPSISITATGPRELRFELDARGSRQAWQLALQPAVREVMNQSLPSAGRRFDLATLSALALPRELRLILRDADFQKLRVIVDGVTANFPWEAVVCNASEVPRLISVLRSISGLAAPSARTGPERSALVIANPEVNSEKYPALPGATEEGAAVAAMLTTVGYATELSSGEPALDVLKRLVMKPYRIVLITGHGEHDAGQVSGGRPTGVVLSGDAVLTAQEFEQMQTAPDIVFLNCPKLGRLAGADSNTSAVDKFLVARLLKFGVRTVIASNWSMDDAAAVRFSKTFFFALLDKGKTVEAAALEARTDALKTSPNDINWATYQLYGDGDYNA